MLLLGRGLKEIVKDNALIQDAFQDAHRPPMLEGIYYPMNKVYRSCVKCGEIGYSSEDIGIFMPSGGAMCIECAGDLINFIEIRR